MWIHAKEVGISQGGQNGKKVKMLTFGLKSQCLTLTNKDKFD